MAAINVATDDTGSVFVLCKGYIYFEVTGAMSITISEAANKHVVYDLTTYRDVLNAGDLGRAWPLLLSTETPPLTGAEPEGTDDRVNHESPREWMKPDTVIAWWSQAGGAGVALGMCRYAQFIGYSNTAPQLMF
jgi:hypothetical protein